MVTPEILSPVGSRDMLTAAVRSGADAVYLGAKEFSARRGAENFTEAELCDAISYCHINGVKAYLALNIILKDDELPSALATATRAYNAGIDGVIIADLALADILRRTLPSLALHASTQLSVHSVSALAPLKELGFCRVVVARELSQNELAAICEEAKRLGLEIEVFVHGALCMSLSGQCLLSAFLGSRSGNRGLCAGPCRLPFRVENGTGYDLSLKDLSLLDYTKQLCELGVASLKIEGRMKRPEYVAAATAAFKGALYGNLEKDLADNLKNVFSRSGFTDGYFKNNLGKEMFGIRTKDDVTSSASSLSLIHELYRRPYQRVELSLTAIFKKDEAAFLSISDGTSTACVYGEIPERAVKRSTEKGEIEKNLLKLGGTPYLVKNCEILLDEGLFISASAVNSLRRDAIEALDKLRASRYRSNAKTTMPTLPTIPFSSSRQRVIIRLESLSQMPKSTNGIDAIILPLECEGIEKAPKGVPLIVDIPRGIANEKLLFTRLLELKKSGFCAAVCDNIALFKIVKAAGLQIISGSGMNIFNSYSLAVNKTLGAKAAILSNEIMLSDAKKIQSAIPKGIIAYGNIPLMLFKNCPIKNGKTCNECDKQGVITDRLGVDFPIRCRIGYSELLNSVPIWLADRKSEFDFLDFIVLYFTREEPSRVGQVISAYSCGDTANIKYTRGLFYRGSL